MALNVWVVRCDVARTVSNGLYAQAYYNQNYTVWGLTPNDQNPQGDGFQVALVSLGNGNVAFQCFGGYNAFASARCGDYGGQVQFQSPNGTWINQVGGDETFAIIPTGDGFFAIYNTYYSRYVTINPNPDGPAQGCYPLNASTGDINQAARFYAYGQQRPMVLDFLDVSNNASGLSFKNASVAGRNLTGFNLSRCDLTEAAGLQSCVLNDANLQQANLSGLRLGGVYIQGADLTGANLSGCDFTSVGDWGSQPPNLAGANLTDAVLIPSMVNVQMPGATLAGVHLSGIDLSGANLSGCDLRQTAVAGCNLAGADLSEVWLCGIDLRGTGLTNVNLSSSDLSGCNLTDVDLTGANLTSVNFTQCIPSGMKLAGNNLTGTAFTGLDFTTVQFPSPLGQSTDSNAPTIFAQAKLPYAAVGLDWSCLDLTGATILGVPTDLAGLNAAGAVLSGRSFQNCNLDGANFAQATLDGTDFTGASLNNAVFNGANMTGAVFTKAKLNDASFVGAALGGVSQDQAAEFSFAYVSNCDFSQANLFGVSFAGASLVGGNKLSGSANLQETDFSNAYMANADLTGAVLQGAKFDGAFMVECILVNVDLSPTRDGSVPSSLTSACLQDADFQGANLAGANLSNAAITDVAGSIPMQYYEQNGNLTPSFPMPYPAGTFPAPSSFSAETVCPNGSPYSVNVSNGLSMAQMMAATNPPTSWSPANQATAPKRHAVAEAGR